MEEGVPQGCSLSPILVSVFINGLLVAVEQAELGVEMSDRGRLEGCCLQMILCGLASLGGVRESYCREWRLKANVSKSAVMTFGKGCVEGSWKWGKQNLPRVSKYT